jgi:signal transduction histidine kinase
VLVDVELEGDAVDSPSAVPKPVARAAFRVALLAMDNVVRHAAATRAVVRLTVDERRLELAITDDGTGIGVAPTRRAGRGILDMRAAAAEVDATLNTEGAEPGTRVTLVWERGAAPPAGAPAGDHLTGSESPPDRRAGPRA